MTAAPDLTLSSTVGPTSFKVAVVDDAFDPLGAAYFDPARLSALLDSIETDEALSNERDAADIPFHTVSDATPEVFDRILSAETPTPLIASRLRSSFAAEFRERDEVLQLVRELKEFGATVETYGVADLASGSLPATELDAVFLDYYFGPVGDSQRVERSIALAKSIVGSLGPLPLIVLMSSQILGGGATRRDERIGVFKEGAEIPGPAFLFAAKAELVGAWQAQVYCEVARNTADVRQALRQVATDLAKSLVESSAGFLGAVNELELGDYAYLQRLRLETDGHPFGDYLGWLFAYRFAAEAFEQRMRPSLSAVNKARFQAMVPSHMPPSERVAEMYEAAVFEQNLGPLGPHPRVKSADVSTAMPMFLFGDVFHSKQKLRVVMVATADCDLASTPDTGLRTVPPTRSVMLIPGNLVPIGQRKSETAFRTDLYTIDGVRYAIEWAFDEWLAVRVGDLSAWLNDGGYDVEHYRRLRPLFAIAVQQAQRNEQGQIGLPLSPPLFRRLKGKAIWVSPSGLDRNVCELAEGDCVVTRVLGGNKPENFYINASVAATLHTEMKLQANADLAAETDTNAVKKAQSIAQQADDRKKWVTLVNGSEAIKWKPPGSTEVRIADLPLALVHCSGALELPEGSKVRGMVLLLKEITETVAAPVEPPIADDTQQPEKKKDGQPSSQEHSNG